MTLRLNNLAIECVIGERPEERERLQSLILDIALEVDDAAAISDALADTVDYAALAEEIRGVLVAARCRLIERAARLVGELVMKKPRVRSCEITVTKSGAVPGLSSASAVFRG